MMNSNELDPLLCPVCKSASKQIRVELAQDIRQMLGEHYKDLDGVKDLEISDYELRVCCHCSLEFAWPMLPGSNSFYEWVCRQPAYYPPYRWEYKEVQKLILNTKLDRPFRILDVGCGSGRFLKYQKESFGDKVECVGIDLTPGAISQADQELIRFVVGDHREFSKEELGEFDLVTSFHCLEHVDDPLSFVEGMIRHASSGSPIAVSTPLSPMSFEFEWKAIMNLPPHHMTRWSREAYEVMAKRLGRTAEFLSEPAASCLGRTSNSVNRAIWGMYPPDSSFARYCSLLRYPVMTMRHLRHQMSRKVLNGRPCGEDMLVILY